MPTTPFWSSDRATLYHGDAKTVLASLPTESVDCIVTSPPYYGQRDYKVKGQIGLEKTPFEFIESLVDVFGEARRVLKPTGALWVNIGDTYWSGKGKPTQPDNKQRNRRFERPQDKTSSHPICKPKQLLLVPHRFAIAMQDDGWVVRNDVIWCKQNPTPDPATDRLASAHEFMFFFTKQAKGYYFNRRAVRVLCADGKSTKNPPTVWNLKSAPTFKKHIAPFQEELLRIPIKATLPINGVLLDPFCGSATALKMALARSKRSRAVGIDISEDFLNEAKGLLI